MIGHWRLWGPGLGQGSDAVLHEGIGVVGTDGLAVAVAVPGRAVHGSPMGAYMFNTCTISNPACSEKVQHPAHRLVYQSPATWMLKCGRYRDTLGGMQAETRHPCISKQRSTQY